MKKEFLLLSQFTPQDLIANEEKMWKEINEQKRRTQYKSSRKKRLLLYAATIIPFLLGVFLFYRYQSTNDNLALGTNIFEPGKNKAQLLINEGQYIDLSDMQDTVLTTQSTSIHIDSSKTIIYQSAIYSEGEIEYNTIVVPRAGECNLVLSDGTKVRLNSMSELRFPLAFKEGQRKVFLKGEAYFDVVSKVNSPFTIEVNDTEVEVLGTQFNINAYPENNGSVTTLVNGKVRIKNISGEELGILSPGQQARISENSFKINDVDVNNHIAWMQGNFYFQKTTLANIALQLERWYDIRFVFMDEELKDEKYSGRISRNDMADSILSIIEKTTNIQFIIEERNVIVLKK